MKFNVHFGAISNTCNTLQLCDHCPQILRIVQTAIFIKPSKSDANKINETMVYGHKPDQCPD